MNWRESLQDSRLRTLCAMRRDSARTFGIGIGSNLALIDGASYAAVNAQPPLAAYSWLSPGALSRRSTCRLTDTGTRSVRSVPLILRDLAPSPGNNAACWSLKSHLVAARCLIGLS